MLEHDDGSRIFGDGGTWWGGSVRITRDIDGVEHNVTFSTGSKRACVQTDAADCADVTGAAQQFESSVTFFGWQTAPPSAVPSRRWRGRP